MKHIIIGTALILFAAFLSPCYFEPSDIVLSTFYITATTATFGPEIAPIIIGVWMIVGYLAVALGIGLIGHSVLKRFGIKGTFFLRNPYMIVVLGIIFSVILTFCIYYFNLVEV